ncbi:MAG: penicillin-binding transpeptidase domain-containing protein [Desulfobacterales bacterium]
MTILFKRRNRKLKYVRQNSSAAWQRYQRRYKKIAAKRRSYARIPGYLFILLIAVLLLKGGLYLFEGVGADAGRQKSPEKPEITSINRSELRELLDPADFINPQDTVIRKKHGDLQYRFQTTLDPDLQKSVVSMLDPKWARHIAIVVMDPETGRILAMASHDKNDSGANPCLSAEFPAASLFKIISAAAAIETLGFKPESEISFNGGKYTLFKSQLKDTQNKYTNSITLESAFAQSVNPVFGKIGSKHLGKDMLEKYAGDFGFNREIGFDLLIDKSIAPISDQSYNWAEVACGFNSDTRMSPLHAAMLASSVIYNGRMLEPRLIDRVAADGKTVYSQKPEPFLRPISPHTSRLLKPLMRTSLTRGTARGTFTDAKGRAMLENYDIGGKTGSINYNPEQIKYDWFAGFARHKDLKKKIAVSVLVAHEKYIGTRASSYFREIVEKYFQQQIKTAELEK